MQSHFAVAKTGLVTELSSPQISLFICPTPEEQHYLIHEAAISEHNIAAALLATSSPRVELELCHIALILKVPSAEIGDDLHDYLLSSVGFFLFESRLVIVSSRPLYLLDIMRLGNTRTPASVLIHIIGYIAQMFTKKLSELTALYEEMERAITTSQENRYMLNMFLLEKQLVYFVNALHGNSSILDKFNFLTKRFVDNNEDISELREVIIENGQCQRLAEIHTGLLSSLVSTRLSIVSNNLNGLMKTLNLITIGIMVPNLVVSVFSMNLKIPFQNNNNAFSIVMVISVVATLIFWFAWRYGVKRTYNNSIH